MITNALVPRMALLLCMLIIASACKDRNREVDPAKIEQTRINQEIARLMMSAEKEQDDVKKSALYGSAAELCLEKGDCRRATQAAHRARRANPGNKSALATLGECYLHRGQYKEARMLIEEALAIDAKYARAQYLLGNVMLALNDETRAAELYESAMQLDPKDARPLNNLAGIMLKKNAARSLEMYQKAIKIRPGWALLHKNAGIAAEAAGKKEIAAQYYEDYIKYNPHAGDREVVEIWKKKLKQ